MRKAGFISTILLSFSLSVQSADTSITVLDKENNALHNIVVELQSDTFDSMQPSNKPVIMQQLEQQFVPHVLAVSKRSVVEFPDSDTVKHHVYSFSPVKTFEIAIYKQSVSREITLEQAGVVELGCNIHDWMLGYIYVAQSPVFTQTDVSGQARFAEPVAGVFSNQAARANIKVKIWHPRLSPADIAKVYQLPSEGELSITLIDDLLPSYSDFDSVHGVNDYE